MTCPACLLVDEVERLRAALSAVRLHLMVRPENRMRQADENVKALVDAALAAPRPSEAPAPPQAPDEALRRAYGKVGDEVAAQTQAERMPAPEHES
jgi:hypothetical protein